MAGEFATPVFFRPLWSAMVAGGARATTFMKVALVDSVDHTLTTLPSLFAAVVVDDTQFQAVQQVQQTVDFFYEAGWYPPRSWISSLTTRGFALTCAATKCMRAIGTWG